MFYISTCVVCMFKGERERERERERRAERERQRQRQTQTQTRTRGRCSGKGRQRKWESYRGRKIDPLSKMWSGMGTECSDELKLHLKRLSIMYKYNGEGKV